MTGIELVDVFVVVGIIGGAIALLWKGGTWLMRIIRRIQDFLDDWNGEPARPGVPARPGFPERIAALEAESAQVATTVEAVSTRLTRVERKIDTAGGTA
ncbi:hypothetical protein [Herbidospora daliensis]|uniref:hypothetical protein n=1 Tax=Herbidospora daliensis TaxID=295585 RepID=UPI0007841829|nr:hypothetical protein [Herbidospora daliensis]